MAAAVSAASSASASMIDDSPLPPLPTASAAALPPVPVVSLARATTLPLAGALPFPLPATTTATATAAGKPLAAPLPVLHAVSIPSASAGASDGGSASVFQALKTQTPKLDATAQKLAKEVFPRDWRLEWKSPILFILSAGTATAAPTATTNSAAPAIPNATTATAPAAAAIPLTPNSSTAAAAGGGSGSGTPTASAAPNIPSVKLENGAAGTTAAAATGALARANTSAAASTSSAPVAGAPNFALLVKNLSLAEAKGLVDRVWNGTLHSDLLKLAGNQFVITTYLDRSYYGRHLNTVASSGVVLIRLQRLLLVAFYSRPTREPTVVSLLEAFAAGLRELGY